MEFSYIDFIVGFLMVGSMAHIVMSRAGVNFPSVFGYSSKANLFHGLLGAFIAIDIYYFSYGFNATINNGLLLGAFDILLLYAIFGRMLHNKIQKNNLAVQQS